MTTLAARHYRHASAGERYDAKFRRWPHRRLADRWERRRLAGLLRRLLAEAAPLDRALDMPAGTGRLHGVLAGFARSVVAADFALPMLRRCRSYALAVGGEAHRLPFRDGSFELVLSLRLAHHLRGAGELQGWLAELARVARRWVVISYKERRCLRSVWGRLRRRHRPAAIALTRIEVECAARETGLEPVACLPLARAFSAQRFLVLRASS